MLLVLETDKFENKKQLDIERSKDLLKIYVDRIEDKGYAVNVFLREKEENTYDEHNMINNSYSGVFYSFFEKKINQRINERRKHKSKHRTLYYELIIKPLSRQHNAHVHYSNICLCYKVMEYKRINNRYKVYKTHNKAFFLLFKCLLKRLESFNEPFIEDYRILVMRVFFPFRSGSVANYYHKKSIGWVREVIYLSILLIVLLLEAFLDSLLFFN